MKGGPFVNFFFLFFLTSKESTHVYSFEKAFKFVVRFRKHLIYRFHGTHSFILRAMLASRLQK